MYLLLVVIFEIENDLFNQILMHCTHYPLKELTYVLKNIYCMDFELISCKNDLILQYRDERNLCVVLL